MSLTSVETYIAKLWPRCLHAVVSIADARKGEALVLVTEHQEAKRETIRDYAKKQGIGELSVPKNIQIVKKLPLLGTGKTDYAIILAEIIKT